ncbi:MAG: glycosyltransferase [Proteobacteria bacterium]|nr:glycosyltransferase [Pseudomonadota bacterium]
MVCYDVSVVVPFRDDEEVIGASVAGLARYLRKQKYSFEIVAVDDDCGDNSVALLALIRADHPELVMANSTGRGRGYQTGVRMAQGRVVWCVEPGAALAALGSFEAAYCRIAGGELDVLVVDGFVLARRNRVLPIVDRVKGYGSGFQRQLVQRSEQRRLSVDGPMQGGLSRRAVQLAAALWQGRGLAV